MAEGHEHAPAPVHPSSPLRLHPTGCIFRDPVYPQPGLSVRRHCERRDAVERYWELGGWALAGNPGPFPTGGNRRLDRYAQPCAWCDRHRRPTRRGHAKVPLAPSSAHTKLLYRNTSTDQGTRAVCRYGNVTIMTTSSAMTPPWTLFANTSPTTRPDGMKIRKIRPVSWVRSDAFV